MKKRTKALTAFLLSLTLLLAMAAPAMAADENVNLGPLDYWNNISTDGRVTVEKGDFLGAPIFQFTSHMYYNDALFEQVFKDVPAGTYQVSIGYANEDISADVFVNGKKITLPDNGNTLEVETVTLNVPTTMDIHVLARFRGAGISILLGPILDRSGDPTPEVPEENLLQNPGFEDGITGWTYTDEERTGIDTTFSQNGFNCAGLLYETHTGMENYLAQTVSAGAGSYTGSVSIFTEEAMNGLGAMVLLEARDAQGNLLATAVSPAVSDTKNAWQEISAAIDAPEGTAQITMKVGGVYCTGAFYLDDARLCHTA